MTRFERMGSVALQKFGPSTAAEMGRRLENQDDPLVIDAFDKGIDEFRRQVRKRVIAQHAQCGLHQSVLQFANRITATPKARQCLWCGHDWHKER